MRAREPGSCSRSLAYKVGVCVCVLVRRVAPCATLACFLNIPCLVLSCFVVSGDFGEGLRVDGVRLVDDRWGMHACMGGRDGSSWREGGYLWGWGVMQRLTYAVCCMLDVCCVSYVVEREGSASWVGLVVGGE
ncbi:hypothetical protein P153DRAFT_64062 [Dothidotthia symphoricarpi CBS 119687]|uniref:Uncharacterized protein n=1 Tax=Dothidotthia symphoricarpi CBS 119687 TaxID=1392245 RepID=A0A6A6A8A9_9PLEO|nr:uncharacterized protein P153DRAFT_64062 [Dothidotthia symphoricarpi CBS 119687]KAF2127314.1 hypothetical protein P153DRAFT_64062 [Dothidotthia symphoricarpi CBS 119687]